MKLSFKGMYILGICIFLSGCADSGVDSYALEDDSVIKKDEMVVNFENYVPSVEKQYTREVEILSFEPNSEINVYDCLLQRSEQEDLITIEIHYPQIRFATEEDKVEVENKINKQIFDYVMMDEYFEWMDSRYNSLLHYDICYVGDGYLSIVFEGYVYEHNHPKAPTALNFDLLTGELVSLGELISDVELEKLISEDSERILEGEGIAVVGGKAGVIEYLNNYLQEENHKNDFFITEKGIKIIVFSKMDDRNYYFTEIELWD